jgi:glycosyltransferase involved in cell wall biosynthesis
MIEVFIVAGVVPPRPTVLADALEQLRARGARVHLACYFDPRKLTIDADLAETRYLPQTGAATSRVVRGVVQGAEAPRRVWLHAQRDRWVRERARRADVLVALDRGSVYTVWRLAHRNRRADAVYGLTPALTAVDRLIDTPRETGWKDRLPMTPSPRVVLTNAGRRAGDLVRVAGAVATGSRIMGIGPARTFWRLALSAPGLPERPRGGLARRVQASMLRAGHADSADRLAAGVARYLHDPQTRADLLGPAADRELAAGRVPSTLQDVAAGELARADGLYLGRHPVRAPMAVARALDLLFHRVAHYDSLSSPLAEDPEGFLAPLHNSAVGRALAAPAGRSGSARPQPTGRPPRLLFLTGLNDNFVLPICERYEATPGVDVRRLDMSPGTAVRSFLGNGRAKLIAHRLTGSSRFGAEAAELFGPDLEWADVVFADWCAVSAGMLSLVDPGTTRVVVRLHSFEAFTWWPHLVDYSRVDDLVFVSEHLRELAVAAIPRLRGPGAPRTHVLTNAMDLHRYAADKPAEARRNLGLIGIGAIAKDPRWAIDVLRVLRGHDPGYRLFLIGNDPNPTLSAAAERYCEGYERDLAELEPDGSVQRLGPTDDVPAALTEIGVILSSSVRESFHCALVEGAASGAIPVVRDWPFFAGKPHSARTVFPADWVVDTPEAAADRILALTGSEETWRSAGKAAAEHALTTWDWTVTVPDYDRVLLSTPATSVH